MKTVGLLAVLSAVSIAFTWWVIRTAEVLFGWFDDRRQRAGGRKKK